MKNYELMAILEKLPSGMELVVSGTMTDEQLHCYDIADVVGGVKIYSVSARVSDVDQDGKQICLLVE